VTEGQVWWRGRIRKFDPRAFLATIGEGRKFLHVERKHGVFAQGDTADAVFYIQTGKIKLSVVSITAGCESIARWAQRGAARLAVFPEQFPWKPDSNGSDVKGRMFHGNSAVPAG
jgi:hypothetical protein